MSHTLKFFLAAAATVAALGTTRTESQTPTFKDGVYLVNQEIPPGTYRSDPNVKGGSCYWKRSAEGDDILNNDITLPGALVTIQPSDYQFESRGCGPWTMLDMAALPVLPIEQQAAPKIDGHYIVGVDMAPGLWWSDGKSSRCYWERANSTQDINDNYRGYGGGAVLIRPTDFEFYASNCGTWRMLDTNALPAQPIEKQAGPKKDGVYIMGINLVPGRWRSSGGGKKCYWETTTAEQKIIDNHYGLAGVIITIPPTAFEFQTSGCGTWTLTEGNGVGTPLGAGQPAPAVAVSPACPTPDICIVRPASGTRVARGNVLTFSGTAAGANFTRYQFQAGVGGSWGHIADFKKPVVNGDLMEWFTGTVPRGTYTIRLQVIDSTGNVRPEKAEVTITIE
jgi:hypothetical protein